MKFEELVAWANKLNVDEIYKLSSNPDLQGKEKNSYLKQPGS
ncbi:hypothetical protein [Thalassotalea atypica]|nr:hypothetical protein [Thalassotalea atypica]